MNPGSTGDVYSNWIEGLESRTSEEYFGIVYYGHGATNQLSRIYNNIILHTNTAFMFLNKEDTSGQEYEFVHNTVYDFTGKSPVKLYCLTTEEPTSVNNVATITMQNNIFGLGLNEEVLTGANGPYKRFYGNTNGK